jgi:hypothetical protein
MIRSLAVMVALATLAGCSSGTPGASPAGRSLPNVTTASSAPDQPPGAAACSLLVTAVKDATLMEPGVAEAIAAASRSGTPTVAAAGARLETAYATAVASRGGDGEPDAVAAVSAAGADMATTCADAGLETVG